MAWEIEGPARLRILKAKAHLSQAWDEIMEGCTETGNADDASDAGHICGIISAVNMLLDSIVPKIEAEGGAS